MREEVKIEIKKLTTKEKVFEFIKFLIKSIIKSVVISYILSIVYINSWIFMTEHGFIKSQILQASFDISHAEYWDMIVVFVCTCSFVYSALSTVSYIYQAKIYVPLVYKTASSGNAKLIMPDSEMDDKEREEALASYNRVIERINQKNSNE